jgi:hypothetical protein
MKTTLKVCLDASILFTLLVLSLSNFSYSANFYFEFLSSHSVDLCLPCYRLYKDSYSAVGEHLLNGVVVGDLSTIPGEAKRKLDDIY